MSLALRLGPKFFACVVLAALSHAKPAPPLVAYRLDSADFQILESPPTLSATLGTLIGTEFPDTTHLLDAIRSAYPNASEIPTELENIVRTGAHLPSTPNSDSACEYMDFPCPVKTIGLDSASIANLRSRYVSRLHLPDFPKSLLQMMMDLVGKGFPEEELLHRALIERIESGFGTCPANFPIKTQKLRVIPEADFNDAFHLLVPPLPQGKSVEDPFPSLLQLISNYRNRTDLCSMEELDAVHKLVAQVYDSQLRATVSARSTKKFPGSPFKAPRWRNDGCGCTVGNLNGVIYGILPGWGSDSRVRRIDFSLMHRVEYYALPIDNEGSFPDPSSVPGTKEFLEEARRHTVKVDWVLVRNDWSDTSIDSRSQLFENLSNKIQGLLKKRFEDPWSLLKRATPLFPNSENFTWGDGVTLHLPGYPTDSVSTRLFVKFYKDLVLALRRLDTRLQVNIMLGRPELDTPEGIMSFEPLAELAELTSPPIADTAAPPQMIETRFLLLLDAPTAWTKKYLQRSLDFRLHGEARQRFIRAAVPVIMHPDLDLEQTKSDITYFTDNYYGMGFWPLPTGLDSTIPSPLHDSISKFILEQYSKDDHAAIPNSIPKKLVCSFRWELRIIQFASLTLVGLVAMAWMFACRIRNFIENNRLRAGAILVGIPIGIFSLLLFNDPDLAALRESKAPYLMMSGLFVATLAGIGTYLHYRSPKPSRANLKQAMDKLRGTGRK